MAILDKSGHDANALLDEDAFQNEQSRKLFEAIDELQSCRANNDMELPELVIVGDQSAGKSSLLQSLTDIPFPVAGRLCTRFPTRIVSRRTPGQAEAIKISITPHLFSSLDQTPYNERLEKYKSFEYTDLEFTASNFQKVLQEAGMLMGIPSFKQPVTNSERIGTDERHFSSDVLKIEISGPNRSHFSIVDVPGIFQSLTKDLTENEKMAVRNMARSYMSNNQSIIVCVASGTNDLANQGAFDMASECDLHGQRTVGVITKCDISQHVEEVIETAQNNEKTLHHGWFVVRNRTPKEVAEEMSRHERIKREQSFFETSPWNKLDESRRGTESLKRYLAGLLCTRIQENFPTILSNIHSRRNEIMVQLQGLGVPRTTIEQKRVYLMEIAQQYHALAKQALDGQYKSLSQEETKLRMIVRDANDVFVAAMKTYGHSVAFVDIPKMSYTQTNAIPNLKADPQIPATTSQPPSVSGPFDLSGSSKPLLPSSSPASVSWPKASVLGRPHEGTKKSPFDDSFVKEGSETVHFHSIVSAYPYKDHSFEELRLSDYLQGHLKANFGIFGEATASKQSKAPSPFGSSGQQIPPQQPPHGPIFGDPVDFSTAWKTASTHAQHNQSSAEIYKWIRNEVKACRGTELEGMLNPDVLTVLFHHQARNWKRLSETHCNSLAARTMDTVFKILGIVCADVNTRNEIATTIGKTKDRRLQSSLKQLSSRMEDVLTSHLQTQNCSFGEKVRKARLLRFQNALDRYRISTSAIPAPASLFAKSSNGDVQGREHSTTELTIDLRDTAALFAELHFSNAGNLEHEIHDALKAYYEIAREDFVEFVTKLVMEPYLNDANGPILFFSPVYIGGLAEEEIERLAAEDPKIVKERKEKQQHLSRLTRAKDIAMKYTTL